MQIAVTGAAGFVGSNLIARLTGQGHHVTAIDRIRPAEPPSHGSVRWIGADILDAAAMVEALEGHDVVYHLVAMITLKQEDPLAWRVNTEGVSTVARAALAAGVGRFIHCSSVHSFDQHRCGEVLTETSPRATDESGLPVYDRSKYAGEQALHRVIEEGLDAVICNPTGIYGPRDDVARLSRLNQMAYDAARGRVPASVGSGFDLVDVRDVVAGLTLAADKGRTGENYLLAGQSVMLHDLMRTAARTTAHRGPLFAVPLGVIKAILPIAEPIGHLFGSDVVSRAALGALFAQPTVSADKARNELGYTSRPPEETIRDLVHSLI